MSRPPAPDEAGGDRGVEAETARSFALLLGTEDLPGPGWAVIEERSWPTGELDPSSEKSRRALVQGGITAWRKLATARPPESAWVEVVPYASAEDALVSLGQVSRFFVGVARPEERVVAEGVVDDQGVPGVDGPWVYEKWSTGGQGEVVDRTVAGAVGAVLFLTCLTGPPASWTWDQAAGLAALQAERVRRA